MWDDIWLKVVCVLYDINITMDIYAHMTQNIKKEASTKFSNLMKNPSENLIDTKHEH